MINPSLMINGVEVANPNYNPKTKAGRLQPPSFIENDIKKIPEDNPIIKTAITEAAKHEGSILNVDWSKYEKYGIHPTRVNTEEELNKERAQNQSALEQTGHSLGQLVENEIALGTLLGLSNIFDVAHSLIKDGEYVGQYANPFTQYLEEAQERNKERLAIYREDPNKSLDFGDFAWWADNFVNVGSTASLLLPSVGITKGISILGKGMKVALTGGKVAYNSSGTFRLVGNVAKKFNATQSTLNKLGHNVRNFENVVGYTVPAVFSRTMENYQEAREVYKDAYDNALAKINSLTDKELEELKLKNSQYANMTNEEIASDIAGMSAQNTFWNDYAMLLMDVVQMRGISKFWRGIPNSAYFATTREMAADAIKKLTKEGAKEVNEAIAKRGFAHNLKIGLINAAKHPLNSIGALELGEGVEEGYQGIASEKGKEVAKHILDPNYTNRTIESYLMDHSIWEQALWGIIGGVVFQGIGRGFDTGKRKYKALKNKDKMTQDQYNRAKMSLEELRQADIQSWNEKTETFYDNMRKINNGENPFKFKRDASGEIIQKEGGGYEYEGFESEEERLKLKQEVLDKHLLDLYQSAADVGNGELLSEFIHSNEIEQGMQEAGVKFDEIDTSIKDFINSRYDYITDAYERAIYDIYGNVDVQNDYAAKMLAKYVANVVLQESYLERDINGQEQIINNLLKNLDYRNFEDTIYDMMDLSTKVDKELIDIDKELEYIDNLYQEGEISKEAYNARKNEINNTRIQLIKDFDYIISNSSYSKIDKDKNETLQFYEEYKQAFKEYSKSYDESNLKSFLSKFNEFSRQLFNQSIYLGRFDINIDENLTNAIKRKNELLIQKSIIASKRPQFKKDFQEQYEDFDRSLKDSINNQIKNSLEIVNGYINEAENEDDLNKRIDTILHNAESLGDKFATAAKILKINGYMIDDESDIMRTLTNMMSSESFKEAIENKRNQLIKKEKDEHIVVVDGRERPMPDEKKDDEKPSVTPKTPKEEQPSEEELSTGRQKLDAETIAAEADLRSYLREIEHVSPDYEAISARDREIYEARQLNLANQARDVIIAIRRDNPQLFNSAILSKDINSEEYKKLYDEMYERLRAYSGDPKAIKSAIKQATYTYYKKELVDQSATDPAYHRFKDPAIKIALQIRESPLSSTTDIKLDAIHKKQLFDDFIKGFIEYKNIPIIEQNGKKVIDVNQLFEALLENNQEHPELDFNYIECAQIFEQLVEYVKENDKYEFINTKDFNKYVKNPTLFFNKLKQAKTFRERVITNMRVNGTRNNYDDDTLKKIIKALSEGTKIYVQFNQKKRKDDLGYNKYGVKFLIKLDGTLKEVGYTALVEQDTTGDTISLQRLIYDEKDILNNNGFIWEHITKEGTCSLDDFFENLFLGIEHLNDNNKDYEDNRKLIKLLYEIHVRDNKLFNTVEDRKLAKELLENPIVKEILEGSAYERQFGFGGSEKSDYEKANQLAKAINSILFFGSEAGLRNAYDSRANYRHFVRTIRQTYEQNYQLQQKLENHDTIEVQFANFQDSSIQHDPNQSHSLQEYSESTSKVNAKDNPIVIVDEGQLIFEDTNDTTIDLTGASSGAMGIVIRNDKNEPIVSWFTKSRKVVPSTQRDKKNTIRNKIYESLKQELVNLLTNYTSQKISLIEFSTAINNLLGGLRGHKDGLFGGTSVIVRPNTGDLFLKFDENYNPKDKNVPADFWVLAKNSKTGKDEISFTFRDKDGDWIRVTKFTKKNIEEAIDNILKHVTFNQSYYMFNNRTKSSDTENTNPYFTKKDNKMVITLNGETFEFNSFSEFAYKVDAFETDITIDDKTGGVESLNEIDDENRGKNPPLIINIDNIQIPVEEHEAFDNKTVDDILSNEEVDTIELIKAYLSSNPNVGEIINLLFGGNVLNLDILPRSIKYAKNDKHGDAKYDKGRIVITKTGKENLDRNPKDIIRMLFHENLHDKFKERKLKDNEEIIENILDTLRATIESLEKDNSPVAQVLLTWIKENKFDNIDEFHQHHGTNVEEAIRSYINTKERTETNKDFADYVDKWLKENGNTEESVQQLIEDRKRKWFAEEWLVECLTRGELIGYLNNTIYTKNGEVVETNIDNSNKSLLQKIIDIFLKILDKIGIKNLGNPNKNTIFAYQYSLLKDNISQDLTKKKEKTVKEEKASPAPESPEKNEAPISDDDFKKQSNDLLERLKQLSIKPTVENETPANDNTGLDEEVPFSSTTDIRLNTRNGLINNNIIGGVNAEHCINVGDMESFVSGFPKSIQPLIAENIRNGNIKFLC